jgi:hypothetical protein
MLLGGQQKRRRGKNQGGGGELNGDQVLHWWGWIIKPIEISYKEKWSKVKGTKEIGVEDVNVIYQQKEET